MKRTYWYAAMTKDEAQHGRMTFYEAVNFDGSATSLKDFIFYISISFPAFKSTCFSPKAGPSCSIVFFYA